MAGPAEFATYCSELLASAGAVRCRRMFGGWGFYLDELFVAIAVGDTLYLKADAQSQPLFEEAGCRRFVYEARGRQQALGFWSAPEDAMDAPRLMQPWARVALQAALRARASPRARR